MDCTVIMYLPALEQWKGREEKRRKASGGVGGVGGGGVVSESPPFPFPFPFRGPWDPRTGRPLIQYILPRLARKTEARAPSIAGPARGAEDTKKGCDMLSSIILLVRKNRRVPTKREIDLSYFISRSMNELR